MFATHSLLRAMLRDVIAAKTEQGHVTSGLEAELAGLPDSYDALYDFARRLTALPLRPDWPFVEPSDLEGIWAECDRSRPLGAIGTVDAADAARRVEAAFVASCCGCVLGKPLEISPSMDELRPAFEAIGEWPIRDYVPERVVAHLPRPLHNSWPETTRGNIRWVAPDDDINYTILGMLILERGGVAFTRNDVRELWLHNLPPGFTFGPERVVLTRAAMATLARGETADYDGWVTLCNPRDELCGALIRADAYGYACPGRPALAAEFAWRDASFTHRRTGIYGTMFVAAAMACAPVIRDRLEVFHTALQFVPHRSRFYRTVADCLDEVAAASDWLDGYRRIHAKYAEFGHCRVHEEVGTLVNTLRFAEDVGDGICKQVMQGDDTDSFGATAGSLLGLYFGPGHLAPRWTAPFNDDVHTTLGAFYERSLTAIAKRMGQLPGRIAADLARGGAVADRSAPAAGLDAAAGIAEPARK